MICEYDLGLRASMTRARTTRRWSQTQNADPYVRRARDSGYRSRAAFKLMEIDDRDRLLTPGIRVLDLGAAPGGWSQLAAERVCVAPDRRPPEAARRLEVGLVVALDRLEMAPIPGVHTLCVDIYSTAVLEDIRCAFHGEHADLAMSDMAPNLTGVRVADQAAAAGLWEVAFGVAGHILRPGGDFLVKVFEGGELAAYRRKLSACFDQVTARKPAASRRQSAEYYLLARGFRGLPDERAADSAKERKGQRSERG